MKLQKLLKLIAIIAYLLIFLSGDFIAIPFFLWLILTAIGGIVSEQLMSIVAIVAVIISCIRLNAPASIKSILMDILCFALMLTPIISRFIAVPLYMFLYSLFLIPFFIFVGCFIASMCFSTGVWMKTHKATLEK